MSKDYMTEGHAAWITYADPAGTVPSEKTNPWETPIGAADQFAPIVDKNGIALFRKTFTVRELKAARVDANASDARRDVRMPPPTTNSNPAGRTTPPGACTTPTTLPPT